MCVLACCLWPCVRKLCMSTCGGNAVPPLASLRGCCEEFRYAMRAASTNEQMQERCRPSYYEALAWTVQPVRSCAGSCRCCAGRPGQGGGCLCRREGRVRAQGAEHAARAAGLLKRQMLCWCKGVGSICKQVQRFKLGACQNLEGSYALLQEAKGVADAVPGWVLWEHALHCPLPFLL